MILSVTTVCRYRRVLQRFTIPRELASLGTVIAASVELVSILVGLQNHDPTAQRTGHLDLLPICIFHREHLLEEIGLTPVLGDDVRGLLCPGHGHVEQPAFLINLIILPTQEHRDDHRFLPDTGEPVSSSLVVDGEHHIRLEAFGGMNRHEPHIQIRTEFIRDRLRAIRDVLFPFESVAAQQPYVVIVSSEEQYLLPVSDKGELLTDLLTYLAVVILGDEVDLAVLSVHPHEILPALAAVPAHELAALLQELAGIIKGLYREDIPEVPVEAVRELITNAIIHRSYGMDNNRTFVGVFDDRIEITSPGMMPLGLSIEKALSGRSNPRNPIIARFFRETKLVEGWGSGIGRSFSMCKEYGLKEPIIQEIDEAIRVTIFRKDSLHVPSDDPTSLPLSDIERMIVTTIENNPQIKINELVLKLGFTDNQVKYAIKKLKNRGILRREGAKQSSRWVIVYSMK